MSHRSRYLIGQKIFTHRFLAIVQKVGENEKTGARLSAIVFSKFNERLMFRSAACARLEGYKGNISENDGPMVRLKSDVRYSV